jgi:hypothetical protein
LSFVGWIELAPGFVGFFRLRRTNLHIASMIAKRETQQQPKIQIYQTAPVLEITNAFLFLRFGNLKFEFVSDFDIRISDLLVSLF